MSLSILFVVIFRYQIAPVYAYGGLVWRDPEPAFVLAGAIMSWALVQALGDRVDGPADLLRAIVVYFLGIPVVTIPNVIDIADRSTSFLLSIADFLAVLGVLTIVRMLATEREDQTAAVSWEKTVVASRPLRARLDLLIGILVAVSALTTVMVQSAYGIKLTPPSFDTMYELRSVYGESLARLAPASIYLVTFQMMAIYPSLLVLGTAIARYRWVLLVAGAGEYTLYCTTTLKQALYGLVLIVAMSLWLRRHRLTPAKLGSGMVLACATAMLADFAIGRTSLTNLFVSRSFFWPGFLPVQYYESFRDREWNAWNGSFFGGNNTSSQLPSYIAGRDLTGAEGVNANASFLADGMANLGFAGVILEGIVLVGLVVLLSKSARSLPLYVSLPLCVFPGIALTNNSPISSILSGGVAGAILVLLSLPRLKDGAPRRSASAGQSGDAPTGLDHDASVGDIRSGSGLRW